MNTPLYLLIAIALGWPAPSMAAGKTRGQGPCANCHDTAKQAAKGAYVHGPVAVAQCKACHRPHRGKGRSQRVAAGPRLCFRCHDAKRLKLASVHRAKKVFGCVACHQPHASKYRFFVRDGERLCKRCHKAGRMRQKKPSTRPCWHAALRFSPKSRPKHAARSAP